MPTLLPGRLEVLVGPSFETVDPGVGLPRDLLLGPDGDLALVGGDLKLSRGAVAIAQAVRQALQLFRGEWFLDTTAGVPYFEEILIKNPNLAALRATLTGAISRVAGITKLQPLRLTYDASRRELTVVWSAATDEGQLGGTVGVAL